MKFIPQRYKWFKLIQAVKTFKLSSDFSQDILDKCLFFASYYGFVCYCVINCGVFIVLALSDKVFVGPWRIT